MRAHDHSTLSALFVGALVSLAAPLMPSSAAAQGEAPSGVVSSADGERAREDTFETARGMGMGAGARATATGTSALAYNPANIALARVYHIETSFQYVAGLSAFTANSAVVDSVSNRLSAGLSFRGFFGSDRDYAGWDSRIALGMALSPQIALGVGMRYVRMNPRRRAEDNTPIGEHARGFTLDASATVTPVEWLHIAVLAHNLIDLDSALAPVQVGGSAGVRLADYGFSLGLDFLVDLSTFESPELIAGLGAEYIAGEIVPVRLGYRRDRGRSLHTLTMGLGYTDQKFGIDLSLRTDVKAPDRQTELIFAFRYHVQ